jgi:hypothetical protein
MDDLIHMQSYLVYVCDDDDDFNQSARYPDRFSTVQTFTACSSTISINIIIPYTTASPKRFLLSGSLFYDPFSVTTLYSAEKNFLRKLPTKMLREFLIVTSVLHTTPISFFLPWSETTLICHINQKMKLFITEKLLSVHI